MNLYELTSEQQRIEAAIIEAGGEVTPEIEEALNNNEVALEAKVTNIRQIMYVAESNNEAIDAEIKRLQALKKSNAATVKALKEWVMYVMESNGITKLETPLFKLGFRRSKAVEVPDESVLIQPFADEIKAYQSYLPDYITLEPKISKTAIKGHLENGEIIYGADIVENKSLTIR